MEYQNDLMRRCKNGGPAAVHKLFAEINKGLKFTSISPGDYVSASALNKLQANHRFRGYAEVVKGTPVLHITQFDGKFRPAADKLFLLPWSWLLDCGGAFTLTLALPKSNPKQPGPTMVARSYLAKGNSALQQIATSDSFVIVLVEKRRLSGVYRVEYTDSSSREIMQALAADTLNHKPEIMDVEETVFWHTLDLATMTRSFSRRDRLMKAWGSVFQELGCHYEKTYFQPTRDAIRDERVNLQSSFHNAPPEWQAYLNFLVDTNIDLAKTLKYLDQATREPGMMFTLHRHAISYMIIMEEHAIDPRHLTLSSSAITMIMLYMISPRITASGTRVASINVLTRELCFSDIAVDEFPEDSVETFWESYKIMMPNVVCNLTLITKAGDVPAHYTTIAEALEKVAVAGTSAAMSDCATTLLGEARACQKWTIPWGATVEVNFGPFKYAQFYDLPGDVHVVLRTEEWQFLVVLIGKSLDGSNNVSVLNKDGLTDESLSTALFMILTAIIRDFYVVEERHKIFRAEKALNLKHKHPPKDVSIVYLPRVKYKYDLDVERVTTNLDYKDRRAHFVSGHVRLSKTVSDRQKNLAALYGIALQEGYTFIKPHERGHKKKETIYRSRSALQSIYEADIYQEGGSIPDWFKFEKDVASLLERMKYAVEHVARNRNGDEGIDVYAQKGDTNWIVQCKCYGKQKVGPREVRELVGAIALQKEKAEGMLVTTGEITEGALALAREAGIRTIDGKEFLSLLLN